jgi:hypothetical protein
MQPEMTRKSYREHLETLSAESLRTWATAHGWLMKDDQMPFFWHGTEGLYLNDGMNPKEKGYALEILARQDDCWPFEVLQDILRN